MDAHDRRDARINQLAALTATISGEGFDNFTNYDPEVQRSVLWLVHEMACEVEAFNSVAQGCIAKVKEQASGGRRGQT